MTRKRKIDIYNELDNFVEENEGEVTHTEIARHFFKLGRNNAIDMACEWLYEYNRKQADKMFGTVHTADVTINVAQFRKDMKGGEE